MTRRDLLAAAPAALAACGANEPYFGNTEPPQSQRIVSAIDNNPSSIDPPLSLGLIDSLVLSMFEGLTSLHPDTGAPMAALATHYEVSSDGLSYTFCLRGHPQPFGTPLPNTSDLPPEYSRGRVAPADAVPARWSDGAPITAHDFAYSWRRAADPATASEYSYLLHDLRNGQEITAGKLPPSALGVAALDAYTLRAELHTPAPYFLELVSSRIFPAVPRHLVEAEGKRWTDPERIVCSGAFRLRALRPYDSIVMEKNPGYYDAGQVMLNELTFLVTRDISTLVNQYRAGVAMLVHPAVPAILPALRRKKDFHAHRAFASGFISFNTRTPPLDDVRLRYALNMATDKRPVADLFGGGWIPASGLTPPSGQYQPPDSLPVTIDGKVYDVLSFNPTDARELLAKIRQPLPERLEFVVPDSPDDVLWAQVLQRQWRANLGIELAIAAVEFQTWIATFRSGNFRHLANAGSQASYVDPAWFLNLFNTRDGYGTHWRDPEYKSILQQARQTADLPLRLNLLAQCERRLLAGNADSSRRLLGGCPAP